MSALEDITDNNEILTGLFKLYSKDPNREIFAYLSLKNYIDWLTKDPNLADTTIYTYGNWEESGLYLIVDCKELIVSSLIPNDRSLGAAMKMLDWRSGYDVFPAAKQQHDIVIQVLKELQNPYRKCEVLIYKLPREDVLNWQMTCPAGYEVTTIKNSDLDFIELFWPLNWNVALRDKNNGKLVAWCERDNTGLLGSLNVFDEYQRQGLGTFVIYQYSQKIAALGEDVWTTFGATNEASKACFEKSKFQCNGYLIVHEKPEEPEKRQASFCNFL